MKGKGIWEAVYIATNVAIYIYITIYIHKVCIYIYTYIHNIYVYTSFRK